MNAFDDAKRMIEQAEQFRKQERQLSDFAAGARAAEAESRERFEAMHSLVTPTPLDISRILPQDDGLASGFRKRLLSWIAEFEKTLDENSEVGARLVSFGQSLTFHLDSIGYWNPALIRFNGTMDDGRPVQLVQHISQISVLLTSLPKVGPKPRRIGFIEQAEDGS